MLCFTNQTGDAITGFNSLRKAQDLYRSYHECFGGLRHVMVVYLVHVIVWSSGNGEVISS